VAGNSTSASAGFVIASVGPEVHLARSRSGQSPAVADRIRSADACHKRTFAGTVKAMAGKQHSTIMIKGFFMNSSVFGAM
jgi:hypothetical protein